MKYLLTLSLVTISSMNFTTELLAYDPNPNVGGILHEIDDIINNSRRNTRRNRNFPRSGLTPHSRTTILPRTYVFGARTSTGALAIQLKNQANLMSIDAYSHYRHNPSFNQIYRAMYKILTDAKHIMLLANDHSRSANRVADITADLYEIDQLFHKVEAGVHNWTSNEHFNNTLPARVNAVKNAIHHLMEDYGIKSKFEHGNIPVPNLGNVPHPNNGNVPLPNPGNGYGARLHVKRLAMELNRRSANMCRIAHGHYRNNAAFRAVYKDMYEVMKEAQHILELANNNVNSDHIATDLNDVDQLFHKIKNGTSRWRPDNSFHDDLPQAMKSVKKTIHHLMEDYGVKSKIGGGNVPVPEPGNVPVPGGF